MAIQLQQAAGGGGGGSARKAGSGGQGECTARQHAARRCPWDGAGVRAPHPSSCFSVFCWNRWKSAISVRYLGGPRAVGRGNEGPAQLGAGAGEERGRAGALRLSPSASCAAGQARRRVHGAPRRSGRHSLAQRKVGGGAAAAQAHQGAVVRARCVRLLRRAAWVEAGCEAHSRQRAAHRMRRALSSTAIAAPKPKPPLPDPPCRTGPGTRAWTARRRGSVQKRCQLRTQQRCAERSAWPGSGRRHAGPRAAGCCGALTPGTPTRASQRPVGWCVTPR